MSHVQIVMKVKLLKENRKNEEFFMGVADYPDCDFVSWDKPIPRPCPKCEGLLVEKKIKKGIQIQCTDCDYKEQPQE